MITFNTLPVRVASIGLAAFVALSGFAVVESFRDPVRLPTDDIDTCTDCHGAASSDSIEHESADEFSSAASRLQARLEDQGYGYVALSALDAALEKRQSVLSRDIAITVKDAKQEREDYTWTLSLSAHPELLPLTRSWSGVSYELDVDALTALITSGNLAESNMVVDTTVNGYAVELGVKRAQSDVTARAGYDYDVAGLLLDIEVAINEGFNKVTHVAEYRKPVVTLVKQGGERLELQLLASGLSNFTGSPDNRAHNVRKAFNDQVNNTYVDANELFSFNSVIDVPVTLDKGWVEATGLFGGGAAPTVGGGICQSSTTVYRAALLAGFPLVEKRNHSLYVSYYEMYGVGMDSTIFPGFHDLRFRNDTGNPIIFQAYTIGEDAYVDIYGVPDGRTVTLEGPYFVGSQPKNKNLRPLGYHDIGWVQTVTYEDGTERVKPLVSSYAKPIPRNLVTKYPVQTITNGSLRSLAPVVAQTN